MQLKYLVGIVFFCALLISPAWATDTSKTKCILALTQLEDATTADVWLKFKEKYDTEDARSWDEPWGPFLSDKIARIERALSGNVEITIEMSFEDHNELLPWFAVKGIEHRMVSTSNGGKTIWVKLHGRTRDVLRTALATNTGNSFNFFELDSNGEYLTKYRERFPNVRVAMTDTLAVLDVNFAEHLVSAVADEKSPILFEVWSQQSQPQIRTIQDLKLEIVDYRDNTYFENMPATIAKLRVLLVRGTASDVLRLASDERTAILSIKLPGKKWNSAGHKIAKFFRGK